MDTTDYVLRFDPPIHEMLDSCRCVLSLHCSILLPLHFLPCFPLLLAPAPICHATALPIVLSLFLSLKFPFHSYVRVAHRRSFPGYHFAFVFSVL
jgi:hypothetical protein